MTRILKSKLDENVGIPGCPQKRKNEIDYLDIVDSRAKKRLDIKNSDVINPFMPPSRKFMEISNRMSELMTISKGLVRGNEKALCNLAYDVFMSLYQDIVERYDIILDLKIKNGKPQDMEPSEDSCTTNLRKVKDKSVIMEIHKRKLANLIMQGEAKNTKHILSMPETREGLNKIYGKNGEYAYKVFKEITDIADKMDWLVDIPIRQDIMEKDPDREMSAGNVMIDWVKKEDSEEKKSKPKEPKYDPDDEEPISESYIPRIIARGVDFPMLLHESVKGLYEILAMGGIPEDANLAETVLSNTGRMDEPEDWKWGPEIAADFRDFINESPNIDKHNNIREEFFKLMFDKETMSTEECLELMRGILSKTPEARTKVEKLISQVMENLEGYEQYKKDMDKYNQELEEYNQELEKYKNYQERPKRDTIDIDRILSDKTPKEIDYTILSRSELQSIIDKALDDGDFETLNKVSTLL
ncbi:hypothetical protein EBU94_03165 [bacterium]|nr:hypothetical protein [bacterium]